MVVNHRDTDQRCDLAEVLSPHFCYLFAFGHETLVVMVG